MVSQLTEICAVPIGDEKYRRELFCILTARQAPPIREDLPRQFSLLGDAEPGELKALLPYRLWGRWQPANQYGESFRFDSFAPAQPHGRAGVVRYLQQARHVGPATAETLWEEFHGDAVRILRETPERAAEAVGPRFSIEKAREAAADLAKLAAAENLTIQLMDLFDGRGFGRSCVQQALKLWGAKAVEVLTRDPHRAQALRGVGFIKADKFYLDLGKPPAKLKRQAYCLSYATLKASDQQGHVWVRWEDGVEYLRAAVAGADVSPEKALTLATRGRLLKTKRDAYGRLWAADIRRAAAEEYVCRHLIDALAGETIEWPSLDRPEFAELTDHQRSELAKALSGTVSLLGGRPGTGKAQPVDAKVLTPTGWINMGQITPGMNVIGDEGKAVRVTAIHPQGFRTVYRVTMSDGASTECTEDHLWYTTTRQERKNCWAGKVRTTAEIMKTLDRGDGSITNHQIPMTKPVEFTQKEWIIHPYLMGLLLGDGCFRAGYAKFTNPEPFLIDAVRNLLPNGVQLKQYKNIDYAITGDGGQNVVTAELERLGLMGKRSPDKHIPNVYLYGSAVNRLALLQGMLDTDGYTDGHNIEYTTSSPHLAMGFIFLVQSLGGTVSLTDRIPTYVNNGEKRNGARSFRFLVSLASAVEPFRLPRKRDAYIPKTKYPPRRYIVAVEPCGIKNCQCISVEGTTGLYLTNDFIVTHNSFTLVRLVRAITAIHGQCVAVMAPTGKAAQRVKELMAEARLTGVKPTTIHSGLGVAKVHEGGWQFQHDERNPLKCRFLIVEEASMLGTGLLRSLLAARARGCGVLFVGDVNQLPPVEYGAPLRDMIAAGLPYGELREIHRNAGTIVRVCSAIVDGQPWQPDEQIDLQAEGGPKNLVLVPAGKASAPAAVCHLLETLRDTSPYDPVWDVQVLVAVNDRSTLSRKILNRQLQDLLNPQAGDRTTPFRVGDKVIQLRNQFIPSAIETKGKGWTSSDDKLLVANGEIGRVIHAEEKKTIVQFPSSDQPVIVFRGSRRNADDSADDGPETTGEHAKATGTRDPQKDDERTDTGCDLDLVYAVTTFKAQGSQFPIAVYCLDEYPGASGEFGVMSREHLYTGISRAQKACFLVGMKHVADSVCRKVFLNRRKTFMQETLREMAAKAGVKLRIVDSDLW